MCCCISSHMHKQLQYVPRRARCSAHACLCRSVWDAAPPSPLLPSGLAAQRRARRAAVSGTPALPHNKGTARTPRTCKWVSVRMHYLQFCQKFLCIIFYNRSERLAMAGQEERGVAQGCSTAALHGTFSLANACEPGEWGVEKLPALAGRRAVPGRLHDRLWPALLHLPSPGGGRGRRHVLPCAGPRQRAVRTHALPSAPGWLAQQVEAVMRHFIVKCCTPSI